MPNVTMMRLDELLVEIGAEYLRAEKVHGPMASGHEGIAVIWEEAEELWELIKQQEPSSYLARREAMQIAAMALRYVIDICDAGNTKGVDFSREIER